MKFTITMFLILLMISCKQNIQDNKTPTSYALTSELKEPAIFGQNEITTTNGINFSNQGDTLYTSGQIDKQFDNGRFYTGVFESLYQSGQWTKPKQVQFGLDIDAYHPVLSMDNKVLFFTQDLT